MYFRERRDASIADEVRDIRISAKKKIGSELTT